MLHSAWAYNPICLWKCQIYAQTTGVWHLNSGIKSTSLLQSSSTQLNSGSETLLHDLYIPANSGWSYSQSQPPNYCMSAACQDTSARAWCCRSQKANFQTETLQCNMLLPQLYRNRGPTLDDVTQWPLVNVLVNLTSLQTRNEISNLLYKYNPDVTDLNYHHLPEEEGTKNK